MAKFTVSCERTVTESAEITVEAATAAEAMQIAAAVYTDGVAGVSDFEFYTGDVTDLDFYVLDEEGGHSTHHASLERAEQGDVDVL